MDPSNYRPYVSGPRNLSPTGEMRLLKYNSDTGLRETVKLIRNDHRIEEVQGGFLKKIFCMPNYLFRYSTEIEWLKESIALAKELGCSRVEYYDSMFDMFRRETVWDKDWN